ncbi:TPA: hypothetical protein N0F65_006048 [Lagenidium giganteum]|uniref:Uncharacterized protein n=1 Tax=Lagenidium giganteum TaxID=4803 RepID=A0AAV2YI22_9STRA|nr:TPA: hypothetical protein N0F65_006048 [Lagenidium giganteum]
MPGSDPFGMPVFPTQQMHYDDHVGASLGNAMYGWGANAVRPPQLTTTVDPVEQQRYSRNEIMFGGPVMGLHDPMSMDSKPMHSYNSHFQAGFVSGQRPMQQSKRPGAREVSIGRWNAEEHKWFLKGLEMFQGPAWGEIARLIGTRTSTQVRTHAQKFFTKLARANQTIPHFEAQIQKERTRLITQGVVAATPTENASVTPTSASAASYINSPITKLSPGKRANSFSPRLSLKRPRDDTPDKMTRPSSGVPDYSANRGQLNDQDLPQGLSDLAFDYAKTKQDSSDILRTPRLFNDGGQNENVATNSLRGEQQPVSFRDLNPARDPSSYNENNENGATALSGTEYSCDPSAVSFVDTPHPGSEWAELDTNPTRYPRGWSGDPTDTSQSNGILTGFSDMDSLPSMDKLLYRNAS